MHVVSMGNLLGSWRFKEPSTVEECDSTWGSDSDSDEPAAEDDSGGSDFVSPGESDRAAAEPGDTSPQVQRSFRRMHVLRGEERGPVTCATVSHTTDQARTPRGQPTACPASGQGAYIR